MKKLRYLIFLFIAILCVTGCGKNSSAKEDLKDAFLKMRDTNAIAMKISMMIGSDEMKIPYDMEISYNKNGIYMKVSVSLWGMSQTEESYMIKKDNESYIYTYLPDDEKWIYVKGDNEYASTFEQILELNDISEEEAKKNIDDFFDIFDEVKKVKSDKDNYEKYELKLNKSSLLDYTKDFIEDEDDEEALKEMEESLKILPESLIINIYLKDGELSIFSIDLSDADFSSGEYGMVLKVYELSFEYLARNDDVKVELPKEVEESATYIDSNTILEEDNFFGKEEM